MVNTGKPSRGCFLCRARKIKCDEARPHCVRCRKSKRDCPGYQDSFKINFHDATGFTRPRGCGLYNKISVGNLGQPNTTGIFSLDTSPLSSSSRGSSTSSYSAVPVVSLFIQSTSKIPRYLSTPIDQRASCFFMANFVLLPIEDSTRGFLHFLIPILKEERSNSSLSLAFSAVGLAALGNRQNSKTLLSMADRSYTRALNSLNVALRDPVLVLKDSILAAVLLLSLFESLTSSRTKPLGWSSHVDGAVTLVKLRGTKQFNTPVGPDILAAVRAHMTTQSMVNSKTPDLEISWRTEQPEKDKSEHQHCELNFRVAELRANSGKTLKMAERTADNIEKVLKLLRQAEAVEQQYNDWEKSLPSKWQYRPVAWAEHDPNADLSSISAFPGRIDGYSDLLMASKFNYSRISRLFASSLVLRCSVWLCTPIDYRIMPEYATAAKIGNEIIQDIVSSIPFFLGGAQNADPMPPNLSEFACGESEEKMPKGLAALLIIWPIFAAASSDFATDSQRAWLRGRLRFIGESVRIQQASVWADFEIRMPSMFIKMDGSTVRPEGSSQGSSPETTPSEMFGKTPRIGALVSSPVEREAAFHATARHLVSQAANNLGADCERCMADFLGV